MVWINSLYVSGEEDWLSVWNIEMQMRFIKLQTTYDKS
jgi:hypothetical protein